jgi:bifunctional non-homologous end joining protein LigD
MSVIESANLYYKEGSSDKVYHATIEDIGGNYVVNFAYGRRGNALKTGSKTNSPTTLDEAKNIFNSLVKEKTSKGYKYIDKTSNEAIPVVSDDLPDTPTEIQCVLLNPIDEDEVDIFLNDDNWAAQPKFDGVRFMLKKESSNKCPSGFNRKGKFVAVPTVIFNVVDKCKKEFFVDGELIGQKFHVFDILEYNGKCIRENKLSDRIKALEDIVKEFNSEHILFTKLFVSKKDKKNLYNTLIAENQEGIVFKKLDAKYYTGRPASGGDYLKHKFYSTCSCVVTGINKQRSVSIGLYKGKKLLKAGNVTISSNFDMPEVSDVVEVRYLYARKQSGSLYQPTFLGKRADIDAKECLQSQLKFKSEED